MKNAISLLRKATYSTDSLKYDTSLKYHHHRVVDLFTIAAAAQTTISCATKITKELIDNGFIFPVNIKESVITVSTGSVTTNVPIPTFSPTRKVANIALGTSSLVNRDKLKEISKNILETTYNSLNLTEKQKSSIIIRAHGEATKRKNVKSLIRFGIEIDVDESEKLKLWKDINGVKKTITDAIHLTRIPICINFQNKLTCEFQEEHLVLYRNKKHSTEKEKLNSNTTCDTPTLEALEVISTSVKDGKDYHPHIHTCMAIELETLFLSLPLKAKKSDIDKTKTSENAKQNLVAQGHKQIKTVEPDWLFTNNHHPNVLLFLYNQIGEQVYNKEITITSQPSKHNTLEDEIFATPSEHFLLILKEEEAEKYYQKASLQEQENRRYKKNTDTRYMTVYDPSTTPPKPIGFRKCTKRTRNNIKLFAENLCSFNVEHRFTTYRPFIITECTDKQKELIELICNQHPNKNNAYIINDKSICHTTRFHAGEPLNTTLTLENIYKVFEWHYSAFYTTYAPGSDEYDNCNYYPLRDSIKLIYSKEQTSNLKNHTLPTLNIFDGLTLIANTTNNNGIVNLFSRNTELSPMFSLSTNKTGVTLHSNNHRLYEFSITFSKDTATIVMGNKNKTTHKVDYNLKERRTKRPMSTLSFLDNLFHHHTQWHDFHADQKGTLEVINRALDKILIKE